MAYHRYRGADVGIVRIFNSILADQKVLFDDGEQLRHETVGTLAARIGDTVELTDYSVPAFGARGAVTASEATWLVGHPTSGPCFRVRTAYGRELAVTGDHSLFRRHPDTGLPQALPVSELRVGDRVAIAGRVDVIERDRKLVSMIDVALKADGDPWRIAVSWPGLGSELHDRRHDVVGLLTSRGERGRQSNWGTLHRWRAAEVAPLGALQHLGIPVSNEAEIRPYSSGATSYLPVNLEINDQMLWLFGLYVAEGCVYDKRPKSAYVNISCDDATLDIAEHILRRDFGVHVVRSKAGPTRGPSLYVHSQLLVDLWRHLGLVEPEKCIPGWILGLPLSRLKWFVDG